MPEIRVTPLGAGQDVGRSCILVSIGGKNVMLDCGMHMGFSDDRRFPDFSYITRNGRLTDFLDCVIISHFHLDHCGALPYFSEMVGYDGPIYMTQPTQAICPILLEDYRKIAVDKKGEANFFTSQMIKDCMKKVVAVHLHQTVQVDDELEIKAYYAGHVLGAAMFQIKVGSESVVYTGDYNMTPDRHLGAAWIDKCRPNLLITESTYATTIRDSKRCRERDFLKKVHETVERGGKVLIPVFALGRAQELCILLETFWERMDLKAPIYFSTGLTEKANHYYKLFIPWTNQKIRKTFVQRNMFEFKHIKAFDRAFADSPGPMVIMPGYCVQGTVGHKILSGQRKLEMEGRQVVITPTLPPPALSHACCDTAAGVMQVEYMSFSAHADARASCSCGQAEPENVLLVHGEAKKMSFLKQKIEQNSVGKPRRGRACEGGFSRACADRARHLAEALSTPPRGQLLYAANGETVTLSTSPSIPVGISLGLLKREMAQGMWAGHAGWGGAAAGQVAPQTAPAPAPAPASQGYSRMPRSPGSCRHPIMKDSNFRLVSSEQALKELGLAEHQLRFTCRVHLHDTRKEQETALRVYSHLKSVLKDHCVQHLPDGSVTVESILIQAAAHSEDPSTKVLLVSWTYQDEELGSYLTSLLKKGLPQAS
ncbi:Integrator complex subunit 11 [Camelus dromedarius]|uniref:Integrator complex subunit 11 n=1 Tax=Camelus dromedarius TaxID=9838 RepID=A0A5N4DDV0_CAMDR|nr:Integrator complex subunit 11 [Camelus dromedarius]